ncbi:MAG: hypothetical protein KDD89_11495 [Anaerolineales bacterium]|nr:hypothetical protein [Anaerolineales bacterium]
MNFLRQLVRFVFVTLGGLALVVMSVSAVRGAIVPVAGQAPDDNTSPATERSNLLFSTYLGRDAWDRGSGVALAPNGDLIVGGYTQSNSWPTTTLALDSAQNRTQKHGQDVFLTRLTAEATDITTSFWFNALDGSATDDITAVGTDAEGAMYATGTTRSSDFCTLLGDDVPGYDTTYNGDSDAFALKISTEGTAVYCTFLGGSDLDTGRALAVAPDGSLIVVGSSWSVDFPVTTGAADPSHNGTRDLFALRLAADGTAVDYATLWGGSNQEEAQGVALTADGQALLVGWTSSADFATTPNAIQSALGGSFDGFLLLLSANGDTAETASFWGGAGEDRLTAVGIAPDQTLFLAGKSAPDTPLPAFDGSLTRLDQSATRVLATYLLGGTADDEISALALDPRGEGRVWVTGRTNSLDFPTSDGSAVQDSTDQDAFLAGFSLALGNPVISEIWGGTDWEHGLALAVRPDGAVVFTGETRSEDFPTTAGVIQPIRDSTYDVFITAVEPHWPSEQNTLYLPLVRK